MKANKTIKYYINGSEITEDTWKKYSVSDMTVTDMGEFWAISNKPKTTIFEVVLKSLEDKEGMSTRHKAATRMASDISYEDQAKKIIEDLEKGSNFPSLKTGFMSPEERVRKFNHLILPEIKSDIALKIQCLTGEDTPKQFKYKEGVKHSEGKLPLDKMITIQFPKALKAICKATAFGHSKYKEVDADFMNFKRVPGGSKEYADALQRHNLDKSQKDIESGLPHIYHKAWNALAELELWIEENE